TKASLISLWAGRRDAQKLLQSADSALRPRCAPSATRRHGVSQKMSGMRCHRCQRESPSGASFCWKCGARLAQSDPGGAAPQLNVSGGLTEIILTPQNPIEGELKQITVLFADLKSSMELIADCDPEEAQKLLDPVLERMKESVQRYEGTTTEVRGDGIM